MIRPPLTQRVRSVSAHARKVEVQQILHTLRGLLSDGEIADWLDIDRMTVAALRVGKFTPSEGLLASLRRFARETRHG
jgi:hypothetical protein